MKIDVIIYRHSNVAMRFGCVASFVATRFFGGLENESNSM